MVYPQQAVTSSLAQSHVIPKYLISALLNNTTFNTTASLETMHRWLRSIPQHVLFQFFAALPKHLMAVLREKVFAAAFEDDDGDTLQAMLTLGANPFEKIPTANEGPILPIEKAVRRSKFNITKTIVSHICQSKTNVEKDNLLRTLLESKSRQIGQSFSQTDWIQLLNILLRAGAEPDVDCFKNLRNSLVLTRYLIDNSQGGMQRWLRAGLLTKYINWCRPEAFYGAMTSALLLMYCLHTRSHEILRSDPETERQLCRAFSAAMQLPTPHITRTIFEVVSELDIQLSIPGTSQAKSHAILEACRMGDWGLAHELASEQPLVSPRSPQADSDKKQCKFVSRAVRENNLAFVKEHLGELSSKTVLWKRHLWLSQAARCGYDEVAIAIIMYVGLPVSSGDRYQTILPLLEHSRTTAVSMLLESDSQWKMALQGACMDQYYIDLEDLLFRTPAIKLNTSSFGNDDVPSTDDVRLTMHMLSYYAIQKDDTNLLKWLIDNGLDMDQVWCAKDHENLRPFCISKLHASRKRRSEDISDLQFSLGDPFGFLSLLSIAAAQNKLSMIKFLLAEGADCRDHTVLEMAVKNVSDVATIATLLDESRTRKSRGIDGYKSAALAQAIRDKSYAVLDMLLDRVDLRNIRCSDSGQRDCLSPLGEAIVRHDLKATNMLLKKGMSLSTLVAYDEILFKYTGKKINTAGLRRYNPLLAAIDIQDMPIIQVPVENGAEIDYPAKQGLLRTRLQRAAEIGNFEIVEYLIQRGAPADSAPFRSGATPLQLAAIGGHVDIATLLLEKGADVNHQPAKGAGRTAFEAASEWGRVDMLYLLMKWGVDLDLGVGEDIFNRNKYELDWGNSYPGRDTQYRRAVYFAEQQGQMATVRLVEHLYHESDTTTEENGQMSESWKVPGQSRLSSEQSFEDWNTWEPNLPTYETEVFADELDFYPGSGMHVPDFVP